MIYTTRSGSVSHPRTGKVMQPKGLGSPVAPIAANEDPRQKLVDWMSDPKNPFFARALVNRYWAHFFNRGIVEPLDDIALTNPPSNPELLDALADDFVKSGYDLKHLIRTICLSRVYGLSSVPNATNAKDKQNFGAIIRGARAPRFCSTRSRKSRCRRRIFPAFPPGLARSTYPTRRSARRFSMPSAVPNATPLANASA